MEGLDEHIYHLPLIELIIFEVVRCYDIYVKLDGYLKSIEKTKRM